MYTFIQKVNLYKNKIEQISQNFVEIFKVKDNFLFTYIYEKILYSPIAISQKGSIHSKDKSSLGTKIKLAIKLGLAFYFLAFVD